MKILISLSLFTFHFSATSQTFTGRLSNEFSGLYLPNVPVRHVINDSVVFTNKDGFFQVNGAVGDMCRIEFKEYQTHDFNLSEKRFSVKIKNKPEFDTVHLGPAQFHQAVSQLIRPPKSMRKRKEGLMFTVLFDVDSSGHIVNYQFPVERIEEDIARNLNSIFDQLQIKFHGRYFNSTFSQKFLYVGGHTKNVEIIHSEKADYVFRRIEVRSLF